MGGRSDEEENEVKAKSIISSTSRKYADNFLLDSFLEIGFETQLSMRRQTKWTESGGKRLA
ncbi:hypothetical protein V1478_015758 [Vespula squamosa]|uniref:Uncharacterized protein n=1 Tax=Vespula squamosa TaxID=30214 RepID=A0ABD2A1Q8_VESSQ